MRLLSRPWTIAALVVLYLARPALLVIDTVVHPGPPPFGWAYAAAIAFCVFSILVAIGLWLRWRPAWVAALFFDGAVLFALAAGVRMFLLTFFFWIVVFVAVTVGAFSGAVVWLLLAGPTQRSFAERGPRQNRSSA